MTLLMRVLKMSKNNFSEELEALQGSRKSSRNPLKIDQIIKKLVKDGQKDEADAIISAAGNEELPMFTLFTALNNAGHDISYTAVRTARRKYSKTEA